MTLGHFTIKLYSRYLLYVVKLTHAIMYSYNSLLYKITIIKSILPPDHSSCSHCNIPREGGDTGSVLPLNYIHFYKTTLVFL